MNIRDLEYLVVLAEQQHFRRAAEICHVSQPTLSGQLRKLEQELGVHLVERSSRKVLFTASGLELVEQARQILREVQQFKEMATHQQDAMKGPLHLGLIPTIGPYLLPLIIPKLRASYPELELFFYELETTPLLMKLERGELDCTIIAAVAASQPFIEYPLYHEPMQLALPTEHPLNLKSPLTLSDLKNQELLMLADGHCLRDQAMEFCFAAGAGEDARFQATSLETLRNMVAAGAGITLIPELAIPTQPQQGIDYRKLIDPEPNRLITLAHRPGSALRQRYETLSQIISKLIGTQLNTKGPNPLP